MLGNALLHPVGNLYEPTERSPPVPKSPLSVSLGVVGAPYLGNGVELVASWNSTTDILDVEVTIDVPTGFELVLGDSSWKGSATANITSRLQCTVRATRLGNWTIRAEAVAKLGDSSFGSEASLYITILENSAIVSTKPFATATTAEAPHLPRTMLASVKIQTKQWTGQALPTPSLPTTLGDSLPGSLTLTGMWYFYACGDVASPQETLAPLKWVTLEVTDASGNYLGGGLTGPTSSLAEGRFSVTISNPGTQLRLRVLADTSAGRVADSAGTVYVAYTSLLGPYGDGTVDVGTFWLPFEPYRAAFRLYENMVWLGWNFLANYATPPKSDMTKITVSYPAIDTSFSKLTNTINIEDNLEGTKSPDVILHEYGHAVMWAVYYPYWPVGAGGDHWITTRSSRPTAWTEGWANFYPSLVEADANARGGYSSSDPVWRPQYVTSTITTNKWDINLETPTWGTSGWDNGDDVEGRVAGALFDFYDTDIDRYDAFSNGFTGIWDVLRNHSAFGVDQNFGDFWNSWKSKGYDQSITGAVGALYQNTLEYEPRFLVPPSGLIASAVSSSQINLSWQDNSADESDFHIERKTGSGDSWSELTQVPVGSTSYPNTGLSSCTTYYYRVRAHRHSDNAYSSYSNEASATTSGCSPPAAPALSSPSNGATGLSSPVTLSWSPSSGAVGYTMYVWRVDTGAVVVYVSTAGTSYSVSLSSGVPYRWMVAAYNGAGYSPWSTVRSFTVGTVSPPAAPTLVSPSDGVSGLSSPVTLSWNAPGGVVTGYTVYGWRVDTGAVLYDLLPAFQTWDMRPLLARPGIYESFFV